MHLVLISLSLSISHHLSLQTGVTKTTHGTKQNCFLGHKSFFQLSRPADDGGRSWGRATNWAGDSISEADCGQEDGDVVGLAAFGVDAGCQGVDGERRQILKWKTLKQYPLVKVADYPPSDTQTQVLYQF